MEPSWATPPETAAPIPFWRALKTNLVSGMRLFFGRGVGPQDFVSTFDQVAVLLVITLTVGGLLDWQRAESGAVLQVDAVYAWGLWLGLCLLLCALIARTLSTTADTRKVILVAATMAPWGLVFLWGTAWTASLGASEDLLYVLRIAVLIVLGVRVIQGAHGTISASAVVVVLVGSLVIGRMDQFLYMDTHAWQAVSADNDEQHSYQDWYATESLFINEPERISEAVDALEAERPGVSDVYYIGFAGDGSQRVFRREALFGQKVFAERMGSGSRSLELINDDDDRITFPIGSVSGLRYALQRVGERMNRDEDVLVLLLTSHGSRDEGIAVNNGTLPLNNMEPEQVQRALDASGIKWRIVIVSACYAGAFLEPLETDHTLIITAADEDHTSFGCADDRDLTYFGEAFLRDALPKARSLVEAFQTAGKAIQQREHAEKLTPSNPQMFLGEAMRAKLASLGNLPLAAATPPDSPTS